MHCGVTHAELKRGRGRPRAPRGNGFEQKLVYYIWGCPGGPNWHVLVVPTTSMLGSAQSVRHVLRLRANARCAMSKA